MENKTLKNPTPPKISSQKTPTTMLNPSVTLQINLAPFDFRHAIHLLHHQIDTFCCPEIDEVLLVYDDNKKRKKTSSSEWEDNNKKMNELLSHLETTNHQVRVLRVDMSNFQKRHVDKYFCSSGETKLHDFRGAPFYSYLFGLFHANNDYILHLDSDMFFGGGSKTWVSEALALMESDKNVLFTSPHPGPPHPQQILINQRYKKHESQAYSFFFKTLSTRIFLADRSRLAKKISCIRPDFLRTAWAILKGFPINETLEDTISALMRTENHVRVDFLGSPPGLWSLHPLKRSENFYNSIPEIIDRLYKMEIPNDQYGYYNFTDSFIDWSDSSKPYK